MPSYNFDPKHLSPLNEITIPRSSLGGLFKGDTEFENRIDTQNFSDSGCTCRVSKVNESYSSHAGTHADKPGHFMASPDFERYPDAQYSGPAIVLDLSGSLSKLLAVSGPAIEAALASISVGDGTSFERILIRTASKSYPTTAQDWFPHLSKDGAEFLAKIGCKMVAIDSPSVDAPTEKDLAGSSHGTLYKHKIAIVENVNLLRFPTSEGFVFTLFDPVRDFPEARGISHMWFF